MLSAHAFLSSHNGIYIAKTTGVTTGQFNFFSSWKQRLVCEPRKARESTMPGDKTRTRSLFTAVISLSLAVVCTLDHRDLQCYHFISARSTTDCFSGSRAYAFREFNVTVGLQGEVFSERACQHNTTQKNTTDHHEF